jgi:hypothetical protein
MSGEEYRRAMDTLARETRMPPESAARIERQLVDAFATHDAAAVIPSAPMKTVGWHLRATRKPIIASWRPWLSAAAAILLVACVAYLRWTGQPRVNVGHLATPPTAAESPAVPPTVSPTIDRSSSVEMATAHSASPTRRPPKTNVVTPSGFVDLPWTAGLPAFESGEIVRMDIPVASLPTYGIDISSGAGKEPVEADVLIGQDGFARAIRLVASSSRSTQ